MIERYFLPILFCVFATTGRGQENYFQQRVDCDITATLNTTDKTLSGKAVIDYTNNSPDTLREMYFHLWTNAYKNGKTALSRQFISRKNSKLYFAKKADRGGYEEVQFIINDEIQQYEVHNGNIDVVRVKLKNPLLPGSKTRIEVPFVEKIPKPFSRIGRGDHSYQMSQWYPKPAVYDKNGWHPMPYLDLGEFYSEFGDYKVTLTLPANFTVAATGTLQTASELEVMADNIKLTNELVAKGDFSSPTLAPMPVTSTKTLTWTAENVHDFAWFAHTNFLIMEDVLTLSSGNEVKTYAYFTPAVAKSWQHAIKYVTRSVAFYSEHVGEYPYPQATAVYGPLDAGGGMEYPMVTIINVHSDTASIDNVITHEVGHNWFYGILASNERYYPWMDEGVNSFYEQRYMDQYHPDLKTRTNKSGLELPKLDTDKIVYTYQARHHYNQPLGLHSDQYAAVNYGVDIYQNTAWMLTLMERRLGTWMFDKAMKRYYDEWKFRHPGPEDMRQVFERTTNQDLGWFFSDAMQWLPNVDYTLDRVESDGQNASLLITNRRGAPNTPFSITGFKDGKPLATQWFDGVALSKEVKLRDYGFDYFGINATRESNELYLQDNFRRANNQRMPHFNLKFAGGLEQLDETNIYALPMLNYNMWDGLGLGATIHNVSIPGRKFEFMATPMYGFKSGRLIGNSYMQYAWLNPDDNGRWLLRLNLRRYTEQQTEPLDVKDSYVKIAPSMVFQLPYVPSSTVVKKFEYQTTILFLNEGRYITNDLGEITGSEQVNDQVNVNELHFHYDDSKAVNPKRLRTGLQHFGFFDDNDEARHKIRWVTELRTAIQYTPRKAVYFRAWGGVMLLNTHKNEAVNPLNRRQFPEAMSIFGQSQNDYNYEGLFLGRNAVSGLASAQVMGLHNGGFKDAQALPNYFGASNKYLASFNIWADLPFLPAILPIQPYVDVAVGDWLSGPESGSNVLYSGGIMFNVMDIFRVHLPLFSSEILKNGVGPNAKTKALSRMSFTLDLQKLNPILLKKDLNKYIAL